jgi:hypothetical protein
VWRQTDATSGSPAGGDDDAARGAEHRYGPVLLLVVVLVDEVVTALRAAIALSLPATLVGGLVGFGDLTAAHPAGRAPAVLEMLLGQLYLVTVIALLVGGLRGRRSGP